jgi:hypothetical protein
LRKASEASASFPCKSAMVAESAAVPEPMGTLQGRNLERTPHPACQMEEAPRQTNLLKR